MRRALLLLPFIYFVGCTGTLEDKMDEANAEVKRTNQNTDELEEKMEETIAGVQETVQQARDLARGQRVQIAFDALFVDPHSTKDFGAKVAAAQTIILFGAENDTALVTDPLIQHRIARYTGCIIPNTKISLAKFNESVFPNVSIVSSDERYGRFVLEFPDGPVPHEVGTISMNTYKILSTAARELLTVAAVSVTHPQMLDNDTKEAIKKYYLRVIRVSTALLAGRELVKDEQTENKEALRLVLGKDILKEDPATLRLGAPEVVREKIKAYRTKVLTRIAIIKKQVETVIAHYGTDEDKKEVANILKDRFEPPYDLILNVKAYMN